MTTSSPRALCALLLGVVASPVLLDAQGLERAPTPIEVHVAAPSAKTPVAPGQVLLVPPNTAVTIAGTSVPMGTATAVKVSVQPPSGSPVSLTAPLGPDNGWSTSFAATSAPGTYTVTATSPDAKNTATATFAVGARIAVTQSAEALVNATTAGVPVIAATLDASLDAVAIHGEFPNHETVTANLQQIKKMNAELPARLQALASAAKALGEIADTYPGGAKELEPITTAMTDAAAALQQHTAKLSALRPAVENTKGVCDRLDAVSEVLSFISLFYDVKAKAYEIIVNLATDKYLGDRIYNAAVPSAQRNSVDKFALTESLKSAAGFLTGHAVSGGSAGGESLKDFVRKPQNLAGDTASLLTGLAFDKYCEKFTGPVTGRFSVDATVNGLKFWGYTAELNGTITLMYEKALAKGAAPIPMTGEIEGNAFFTMYEDLMNYNAFNKQFVLKRFLVPPVGTGTTGQAVSGPLGKIGRMATPGYYRVALKGRLDPGNQLVVTVQDAALMDFSPAVKGTAVYVVLPPASPVPYTMISTIPVQKAQFIFSRGLRTTGSLPVVTRTAGKNMIKVAEKTFDRVEHVSNGEVTVTWTINVKACNPECP